MSSRVRIRLWSTNVEHLNDVVNQLVEIAKKLGFKISFYDRRKEPLEIKKAEGKTIPWGIEQAVRKLKGKIPDIVYHLGDWGKEPMINVFGRDAVDVALKIVKLNGSHIQFH